MSTVYVPHEPMPNGRGWTPDLGPATGYGIIKYVFGGSEQAYNNTPLRVDQAQERLADFDPAADYILWPNTGDPATQWIVIMTLLAMGHRNIKFLYWNRERSDSGSVIQGKGYYMPVEIDVQSVQPLSNTQNFNS